MSSQPSQPQSREGHPTLPSSPVPMSLLLLSLCGLEMRGEAACTQGHKVLELPSSKVSMWTTQPALSEGDGSVGAEFERSLFESTFFQKYFEGELSLPFHPSNWPPTFPFRSRS